MKRFLFAALAFLAMAMPNEASAQAYRGTYTQKPAKNSSSNFFEHSDMYYGVRLGVGFNGISSTSTFLKGGSTTAGLHIGGVVGFQLTDEAPLYVETGLSYAHKGGKGNYSNSDTDPTKVRNYIAKYSLDYLEIPAVIKYVYSADDKLSVQPFAGLYVDTGLGGKIKLQDGTYREDHPAFSDYDNDDVHFTRFDIGLKLGCGVSYDVFYGEVYYDLGLTNTCNDGLESTHNRRFGINVGVNF